MSRVYVGGLRDTITERELEDEFNQYGAIRSIWVARKPPGFAFVEFEDIRDAEDACKRGDGRNGWRVELSRRPPGARAREEFGGPPRQPRGEFRCYECNELGHLARDCRLRREGGGRRYSPPRGRRDHSPRGYGRDRSPPRRRDDSPPRGRRDDSPPRGRRGDSPRRRDDSPRRRDDSPRRERRASPPEERRASPPRGRRDSRSPVANGRGGSPAGSPPRRGRSASPRGGDDRDRSRS